MSSIRTMKISYVCLSAMILACGIIATPVRIDVSPVTLPIAVQVNAQGGPLALINRDRARFQAMTVRGLAKINGNNTDIPVPVDDSGVRLCLIKYAFLTAFFLSSANLYC